MADSTLLFTFDRFSGMNNVDKSMRLNTIRDNQGKSYAEMDTLENVDIDNQFVLSTRPGCDKKLNGTDIHSIWSDGETCLFVDGSNLYSLSIGYASHLLLSNLVAGDRMSYAPWDTKIYLTNGHYIGYYNNNSVSPLAAPGVMYKLPLPPGQRIAYYRGRLYLAKGKVLYISDALCDHYDIRTGFRVFENDITMLIAVDKGLYVSDGKTWWIPGAEPEEFQKIKVLDSDAIPFTDKLINGSLVGDGIDGNLAIWASDEGICLGDNSGNVKNLTKIRYAMPSHGAGGAEIRKSNGTVHYITTLA
jgi:hypothetical protein